MFEKYLNNRFIILYLIPFILGSLTILSFEPFNLTIINLAIFPIFFYLITYINKKSKSVYRKKPYKKIYLFMVYYLVLVFISVVYHGLLIHLLLMKILKY